MEPMEGSSRRPPPPPPEMEFMDSMMIPGVAEGPPDIMNMFNFIDSIGPSAVRVDAGGAAPYITREQTMYAAEYCRLQDTIDALSREKVELKDKLSRYEQELQKAREPRVVSISSSADKVMILELKRNENILQAKLSEQKNQFEQIKSQFQMQNVAVAEREQEMKEYRSVIAAQKVLLENNEEKISGYRRSIDKLVDERGSLQQKVEEKEKAISSIQDKLSSLEDNLKTKQNEVEGVKKALEKEGKCRKDTEASFMKLQKSVGDFNLEFSQFIDELKAVTNFGETESAECPLESVNPTISLLNKLESLACHVKNKFQSLQDKQTNTKEELARIKEVVCSLKLMLDAQRPENQTQAQSTQTEPPEVPIFSPNNTNELSSTVGTTSTCVFQKPTYSSAAQVQSSLTSEAERQAPQSIFPSDNFEFPALIPPLSSVEIINEAADTSTSAIPFINVTPSTTVANGVRSSNTTHGIDCSKSRVGFFCLCGQKCSTLQTLKVHIKYFTREWQFKCKLCTQRFFNLVKWNSHMERSHRVKNPHKKGWSGCTECGQRFPSRIKLYQHKKTVHTVQTSKKTIIKHTLSKLSKPKPMDKSSDDRANKSIDEVSKISLKKGKTRNRSSLWNVVFNENDSSSSKMWESFDEDDTEQEKNNGNGDDGDNATATNKPSTSKPADKHRHGQDNSKEGPGYYCFCGYHHPFNKVRVLLHIQYYTADPKFSCHLCGKRFIGSNYLRRHCQRAHKTTCAASIGCWKCGEQFENRKLLIKHQKLVHGRRGARGKKNIAVQHKSIPSVTLTSHSQDNEPTTSAADKTGDPLVTPQKTIEFKKKSASQFKIILKHRKSLSSNENRLPISCVCGYKAKNEDCFRSHVKYFDKKYHFVCDVCDKGFKTTGNLRSHMKNVHEMSYNMKGCRLCGKVFETLEKLRNHQSVKHTNAMEGEVTNASSVISSKTNPTRNAMIPPLTENSTGTSFILSTPSSQSPKNPILTKAQTTTSSLIVTLKRKHGVDLSKRNLGCYCICGTKRSDRKALNQHIHYFTAERKFQCKHCNCKFLHLARLKAHTKRKHKNASIEELGTLGCSECGLTFHSHLELFQHRKIHSAVEGSSNSTPITTRISISSPLPQDKSRSTSHAIITPQSQLRPPTKRAHSASSTISAHRRLRVGKNSDVFYCLCGIQFETDLMLRQHIFDEDARSAENQSCVQSAQVWTPPSHRKLNAAGEATSSEEGSNDKIAQAEESSISLSHNAPSSSTSAKNFITRLDDETRPLTHAIDKSKEKIGLGLFCRCGLGFKSEENLHHHLQFHRNGKKFACELCQQKFKENKVLNKHMKAKHGSDATKRSQFGCQSCGQIFASGEEISRHRTKIFSFAGKLMKVFCPSSMLESTNSGIVNDPLVQQAQGRELVENISLDTTTMEGYEMSLGSLINDTGAPELPRRDNSTGINKATNQPLNFLEPQLVPPESQDRPIHGIDTTKSYLGFVCFCGQRCSNKATLNKHIKRFTAERKFVCKTCGKGFLAPSLLQRHMLQVHKVVSNGSIGCHRCGELFPTNMELYHHFRIVHNYGCAWEREPRELKYTPSVPSSSQDFSQEEPVVVQTNSTVAANGDGRIAQQAHRALPADPLAENLVHQCSCEKTFFTRNGLMSHIQVQTVGKIFKCLWCSFRCTTHSNLKQHVKITHKMDYQNFKYACGICAQTFATLEDVTKHRRTTHENWAKKPDKSSSINEVMEQ